MHKKIAKALILTTTLTGMILSFIPKNPVKAQANEIYFVCNQGYDKDDGKRLPTTYVWSAGKKIALIRWVKPIGDYSPQKRCDLISPRFQEAYNKDGLSIITNGYMNNQPVICTANEYGGDCVTLLFTLRTPKDALPVLNELKDALLGRGIGPRRESSSGVPQIYYSIDLKQAIENAPVEQE